MTQEEKIESRIWVYVARLRRGLGTLQPAEIDDIVMEIRGHIGERLESSDDPAATLEQVLAALGNPEELASRFMTEAVLARGRSSASPLTLLRASQRWAMEGVFGLVVFLLAILGYGSAIALVLAGVLKPFFPGYIGLWWGPPELVALGFAAGPPDPSLELLGWWMVPFGLATGGLLWVGMSRLLRALLRRYREFSSPLDPSAAALA